MRELILKKFNVSLSVTSVGSLLAKLNLTPQKPLQRACQRDPEAIERSQYLSGHCQAGQGGGRGNLFLGRV